MTACSSIWNQYRWEREFWRPIGPRRSLKATGATPSGVETNDQFLQGVLDPAPYYAHVHIQLPGQGAGMEEEDVLCEV